MSTLDEAVGAKETESQETGSQADQEESSFVRRRQQQAADLYRATEDLRGAVLGLRSLAVVLIAVMVVAIIVIGLRGSGEE